MDYSTLPIEDGFAVEKLFSQGYPYTYDDVIFLTHYIDFPSDSVQLATQLIRNIPCVASYMDAVSEAHMAAAMLVLGGIAIVHSITTPSLQAAMVRSAKSRWVLILTNPTLKTPSDRIESESDFGDSSCVLVSETGSSKSKLLGYVWKADWLKMGDKGVKIDDYMVNSKDSASWDLDFKGMGEFLAKTGRGFVQLVKGDEVADVVSKEDLERIKRYPKLIFRVSWIGWRMDGRCFHWDKGARKGEVGTFGQVWGECGGAENFIHAGADGPRVGVGSCSICTTQEICALGRGQATAVYEVSSIASTTGVPIIGS